MKIKVVQKLFTIALIGLSLACSKKDDAEVKVVGDLVGKWNISRKVTYSSSNVQLSANFHDHECRTKQDYYEINSNGTGGEYRHDLNCTATRKNKLTIKNTENGYLIESSNGEVYSIKTLKKDYLELRHNMSSGYFILDLYRDGIPR